MCCLACWLDLIVWIPAMLDPKSMKFSLGFIKWDLKFCKVCCASGFFTIHASLCQNSSCFWLTSTQVWWLELMWHLVWLQWLIVVNPQLYCIIDIFGLLGQSFLLLVVTLLLLIHLLRYLDRFEISAVK